MSITYWWSEDRKWFCILADDGVCKSTVSLTQKEARDLAAAIDRLDVKAEAKSQEPVAAAWRRRRKGIVGNGGWIMCPEYPGRDREFDLEHLYTHPTTEAPAVSVDAETVQTLLDLLNPLHGAIDEQTYDERYSQGFDAPRDVEYSVNVTAQQERDLTQAVLILENRRRAGER